MSVEERRALVARRDRDKVKAADNRRYLKDREKRLAASREYAKAHPESVGESKRQWIARNPEKRRAQSAVSNAQVAGKLTKEPCLFCDDEQVHAHHHDYSRPLDVTWLCARHHKLAHRSDDLLQGGRA